MQVEAGLDAPCAADVLFGLVDDLGRYPQWLDLVARADPVPSSGETAGATAGETAGETAADGAPAWLVDLRASIGPFTRSKRLRMVRTEHDREHTRVVFERAEMDGRHHAKWTLQAQVADLLDGAGSSLSMTLSYAGALWTGGLLERALTEQIIAGRARLLALIETTR